MFGMKGVQAINIVFPIDNAATTHNVFINENHVKCKTLMHAT